MFKFAFNIFRYLILLIFVDINVSKDLKIEPKFKLDHKPC